MKSMKRISMGIAVAALGFCCYSCRPVDTSVSSPDGEIIVNVGTKDGRIFYTVDYKNQAVMDTSYLSLDLKECTIGQNARINKLTHSSFEETWDQPWGEEITVENKYNEMAVDFEEENHKFSIVFRVFDDGLGFRYVIPEQENLTSVTIMDENTEFSLAHDATAWSIPWDYEFYEALYRPSLVSELDTVCAPLTMKMTDSLYVTIHQANLTNYAMMNLVGEDNTTRLHSYLIPWSTGEKVISHAPMQSPWRTVIIAEKPGDLILSRLMLNLNEPCKIEDTSWIEPSRYVGIWWGMHKKVYTWHQGEKHGATTENALRHIDFAAKYGYDGVLVEGWNYGWDGDWTVNGHMFNYTKAYPDFDIEAVADYARKKGVRLIGHHETGGAASNYEQQMDSAYAFYQRLGVNTVKTGYVGKRIDKKEIHGSQYVIRHYRKVLETAAKYHIMIDNHEPAMPSGLQRTYPNLMTQEGVRGQEYDAFSPDGGNPPEHTVTLPFTRGLAGPMDFTPGTFNYDNPSLPGTRPRTTRAKQLALAVVLFSPLQMSSDMIENYEGHPEFEFLYRCPANWSLTVVPEAEIGEYVTIARKDRNSDTWYVGSITGQNAHDFDMPLSFLDPDTEYVARVFADGEGADYMTNPYPVKITDIDVTSASVLPLRLVASGGAAVIISKK